MNRFANGSYVYKCSRCEKVGWKWHVLDHALKTHVEKVPFYCQLCKFRYKNLQTLLDQTRKYKKHTEIVRRQGHCDLQKVLVQSRDPIFIRDAWAIVVGQEAQPALGSEDPLSTEAVFEDAPLIASPALLAISCSPAEPDLSTTPAILSELQSFTSSLSLALVPQALRSSAQTQAVPAQTQAIAMPASAQLPKGHHSSVAKIAAGVPQAGATPTLAVNGLFCFKRKASSTSTGTPLLDDNLGDAVMQGPADTSEQLFLGEEVAPKKPKVDEGLGDRLKEIMEGCKSRIVSAVVENTKAIKSLQASMDHMRYED